MTGLGFTVRDGEPLVGQLVYANSEHSFRFEPLSGGGFEKRLGEDGRTSLSIGTLQIELDVASCETLFAWGLHPRQRWVVGQAKPSKIRTGIVRVHGAGLRRAVTVRLADVGDWATIFDPETGWVRVMGPQGIDDEEQVLIASNTALGLRSGQLTSLWLAPRFED